MDDSGDRSVLRAESSRNVIASGGGRSQDSNERAGGMSSAMAGGAAGGEQRGAGRNGGGGGGGMGAVTSVTLARAVTNFPLACEGLAPLIHAVATAHGLRELLKQAAFQAKEAIEEATKVWNVKIWLGSRCVGGKSVVCVLQCPG